MTVTCSDVEITKDVFVLLIKMKSNPYVMKLL